MKHFILTRFNLRNPNWETLKNGEAVLTDAWLKHRFEIFETYCLPSVCNQNNKNFIWCICFDLNTPKKYKDRIEFLMENYNNFFVLYIDGFEKMTQSIKVFIQQQLSETDCFLITTRLDNDDLIHEDFVKTIQDNSVNDDKTLIDLINGYQLILKPKGNLIKKYRSEFNPFISLVENTKTFNTVLFQEHHEWKKTKSIVSIEKNALWIQLIHKKNYFNSSLSINKLTSNFNPKDFGLNPNFKTQSKTTTNFINIIQTPIRALMNVKNKLKN